MLPTAIDTLIVLFGQSSTSITLLIPFKPMFLLLFCWLRGKSIRMPPRFKSRLHCSAFSVYRIYTNTYMNTIMCLYLGDSFSIIRPTCIERFLFVFINIIKRLVDHSRILDGKRFQRLQIQSPWIQLRHSRGRLKTIGPFIFPQAP